MSNLHRNVCFFLVTILFIAGCDTQTADNTQENSSTNQTDSKKSKTNVDLKNVKLGISMYTLGAPYFVAQLETAKAKAESLGMTVISNEARDDISTQISNVENMLAQGIDILIFNPKDPLAMVPVTKQATQAGVPIVIIDSSISPKADFVTTIQSNNMKNGELIGEWLVKKMAGQPMKIALLSGVPGNPVGKERRQGVFRGIIEQQLRSKSQCTLDVVGHGWGNWTQEGGLNAAENLLVAHPDINVLLAENDSMALGALKAINESGKTDDILVLAAADGQKEALELIQQGKYGATGLNDPVLIAERAVEVCVEILNGKTDFSPTTYTPAVCITQDNVDQYYKADAIF